MGNGFNPFLLVVETSLKTMNVHIIASHEKRDEGNEAYRLKWWNSEAVRWLSIYMGNDRNPFLLVEETSLKTMNVHIIALHEKRDEGVGVCHDYAWS